MSTSIKFLLGTFEVQDLWEYDATVPGNVYIMDKETLQGFRHVKDHNGSRVVTYQDGKAYMFGQLVVFVDRPCFEKGIC
jgi:hypothetical protein